MHQAIGALIIHINHFHLETGPFLPTGVSIWIITLLLILLFLTIVNWTCITLGDLYLL